MAGLEQRLANLERRHPTQRVFPALEIKCGEPEPILEEGQLLIVNCIGANPNCKVCKHPSWIKNFGLSATL